MANKITYADKVAINPRKVAINQVQDRDMNEIKAMHNLNDDRIDALTSGFIGALAIADTPTEDGVYIASESGTYVNAGSLVVDLTNTISFISVTATQTVFELTEIPITLSGYSVVTNLTDFDTLISNSTTGTWLILNDFTLDANKTIPAGVTLEFRGIINLSAYDLQGTNTNINCGIKQIFSGNGALTGTWADVEFYPQWFGAIADGLSASEDTAALGLLIASTAKRITFPSGIYTSGFENRTSDRLFTFQDGAIIDGVAHIATGTGPDYNYNGSSIEWVENVRVIGSLVSTHRVGTFYCKKLNIDKIRITEIDAAYTNQTALGGSAGVHVYHGSKDVKIGEIVIDSTTTNLYALGIDKGATSDADHYPENVSIGKLVVRNNTETVITSSSTINTKIGEIIVYSHGGIGTGFVHTNDVNFRIGDCIVDSSNTPAATNTITINSGTDISYNYLEINDSQQIAILVNTGGHLQAKHIKINTAVNDGLRLVGTAIIGLFEVNNVVNGLKIQSTISPVNIQKVIADSCTTSVNISAANAVVNEITSTNATTYGLYAPASAVNFYNQYIYVDGGTTGIRCLTPEINLGVIKLANCGTGFNGSGMDIFSYHSIEFDTNSFDINIDFETLTNFKGKLQRELISYTVATLPTGAIGDRAIVTDATTPTYLGTLTGGGAVTCAVFHNGTAWVSN